MVLGVLWEFRNGVFVALRDGDITGLPLRRGLGARLVRRIVVICLRRLLRILLGWLRSLARRRVAAIRLLFLLALGETAALTTGTVLASHSCADDDDEVFRNE
jgi:hypothetical protein